MTGLAILIIVAIIAVVISVSLKNSKSRKQADNSSASHTEPELDDIHEAVVLSAESLIRVVNESLQIASESNNAETKVSRLDVAKKRLNDLKNLAKKHPFVKLQQLPEVEQAIQNLENDFTLANYQETADGNMNGSALEKKGRIDEAISVYETLLSNGVDTPFTYRRLAIIYSKRKDKEEELRVLRAAIKNIPIENSRHYQWFADRLAKKE